ncbi:transcriptional regulator [Serratia marcescens]|uniref:transcriptional regulator n=1 Tax=Serratia marcescens TaxID=615 RepID=UPI0013DBFC70|nr:transcriptional regulator [Serratia marcescens]
MKSKLSPEVSFADDEKESFKQRLQQLIGHRSVRAAARDWGLSVSTLNNYLTKGTEPALKVVQVVAKKERVSLDWLANGIESSTLAAPSVPTAPSIQNDNHLRNMWLMVLDSLDEPDALALIKAIHRKGVEGLLSTTAEQEDAEDIIDKMKIRPTLKQAIKMALAGDESTDQEILRRLGLAEHSPSTGAVTEANQEQSKKIAG